MTTERATYRTYHNNSNVPALGTVTIEPLLQLDRYWQDSTTPPTWDCPFMLPPWLKAWWSSFGEGLESYLCTVSQNGILLGIAPLTLSSNGADLVSDTELIDYSDFIIAPTRERDFFAILFNHLRYEGIRRVGLGRVRSDSAALSCLRAYSGPLGCAVSCKPAGVLYEMDLPDSWEGYLGLLSGQDRHETRRKLRRLAEAGDAVLRVIEERRDVPTAMDNFMALFRSNRSDKAQFMTGDRESFFRTLAVNMAEVGLLRLFFLDLNNIPAAAAMCFDYGKTLYLYNSGYDQRFSHLSVGLLSTVFSIREGISRGRKGYSFLRGSEIYKRRLGGHPVRLRHCEVILR